MKRKVKKKKKRVKTMAKTKWRTRYAKAKRRYPRAAGIGGKFKPAINGAICGAGGRFAAPYLGQWAQPVVNGAVGFLMHDKTAMFLAGYSAGQMIGGSNGSGSNGMVR